jgi:hypothetical protein
MTTKPNPFRRLLYSSKFWLGVFGIVQALVLEYLSVPDSVWQSIAGLVMVMIGSIAIEDHGAKSGGSQPIAAAGDVNVTNVEQTPNP